MLNNVHHTFPATASADLWLPDTVSWPVLSVDLARNQEIHTVLHHARV